MPYEFSGRYVFASSLRTLDHEIAQQAAAIQRELAELDDAPAPAEDAVRLPAMLRT